MLDVVMTSLFVAAVYVLLPLMMRKTTRVPPCTRFHGRLWTPPCHRDRQDILTALRAGT